MADLHLNEMGLTKSEQAVMDSMMIAYEKFLQLERQHPDELRDFVDGIHKCQDVLALRVVRRTYPIGWPNKANITLQTRKILMED
jgi:hypothetical protein